MPTMNDHEKKEERSDRAKIADMSPESWSVPWLVVVDPGSDASASIGKVFVVRSSPFTIGRAPDNSLACGSDSASRRHAAMVCRDQGWHILDSSSTGGTFVNGARSSEAKLETGTRIKIGSVVYRFLDSADIDAKRSVLAGEGGPAGAYESEALFARTPADADCGSSEGSQRIFSATFTPNGKSAHKTIPLLADYEVFRSSVSFPARYRVPARLEASWRYNVPKPMPTRFTEPPPIANIVAVPEPPLLSRFRVRWPHYVMFWLVPRLRREHDLRNQERLRRHAADAKRVEADNESHAAWAARKAAHKTQNSETLTAWLLAVESSQRALERERARVESQHKRYRTGDGQAVADFFAFHLWAVPLPTWCPPQHEVHYDPTTGTLLIEAALPHFASMRILKSRPAKFGTENVPANQKESREFAENFAYLIVLRLLWEAVQIDDAAKVRLVCCNGSVAYDDPATGRRREDVIMSIAAKPDEVRNLLLDRLDPEQCFKKMRGVAAPRLIDLVPVAPAISFNKADARFVEGKDVLHSVSGLNLAAMDWQDFEHLIRELFEKEFSAPGAEVRITQASRDRGVDAVIFDPDPLRGGKTIIQAKRYTNTVDVSAVRDLFGTVQAEGANKGILVTTSTFGPDAYAFVQNKPLALVDGRNLLHLLSKHGYHARIDLKQAKESLAKVESGAKGPGQRG